MSFTEKIDVLELLLNLLKENETKLETLIEKIETVEHTVTQNPKLSKTNVPATSRMKRSRTIWPLLSHRNEAAQVPGSSSSFQWLTISRD